MQGKAWGHTTLVFDNELTSIHYLNVKKGGYCSEHQHLKKSNLFHVISGELELSFFIDAVCDKTILLAGQTMIIPAKYFHKFEAITDVQCIEVYEPGRLPKDIMRRTSGGINDGNN